MRYAGPLTPTQAAAFWRLGVLNGDDLRRLALQWLEDGNDSSGVAMLAGERGATLREQGALFERCLAESGASIGSERKAAWLYIQTLLGAIEARFDPLDAVHDVLILDHKGVALFPPRNLANGQPFAGEELGIETLLGLCYELDDVDIDQSAADRALTDLKVECARVLAPLYTTPLSGLSE